MPKPTETDKERFRSLVPDDPRVEIKPMFGNLGAFVNGNMFMGLWVFVRVDGPQSIRTMDANMDGIGHEVVKDDCHHHR